MNAFVPAESPLKQVIKLFLRLGFTAFGGPAAHIALMQNEVVVKRGWLKQEEFMDMLSATNFIPGPNSTEMAIHIGHKVAGRAGLLAAGLCFILPAALIVTAFAWAYVAYGSLPAFQTILYGIKPVIIAVVAQAIWSLGRSALKNRLLWSIGLVAFLANALGTNELIVIFAAGLVSLALTQKNSGGIALSWFPWWPWQLAGASIAAGTVTAFSLSKLFLFFLKVGSVLFGSGYVLLAFLRTDLVDRFHWLTESQLLDAVAVGQFTPGPVFTTATFIGYLLAGPSGAALATIGIFLPAFFFVALTAPFMPKLRKSKPFAAALDGINVASLAVMAFTAAFLAKSSITDWLTALVAIAAGILLIRYKVNSAILVLAGGIIGFLFSR